MPEKRSLNPDAKAVRAAELAGESLARACARYADDKKAADIAVLDVRGLASFADFLVVCGATSEPHLRAVASGIAESLRTEHKVKLYRSDGLPASAWIVLDFVDVVVHVFREDTRAFYGLEDLWNDAPRVMWQGEDSSPRKAGGGPSAVAKAARTAPGRTKKAGSATHKPREKRP